MSKNPNIPIDKLRAVSPEMGDLMSDIDNSHIIDVLCFMQNKKSKTLRVNSLYEDLWAIARDLLRLAEENEELKDKIHKLESVPVKVRTISDLEFEPIDDDPASAGKPKT